MRRFFRSLGIGLPAVISAILLFGMTVEAGGATLRLTGDTGVAVSIDGVFLGQLPRTDPIILKPGLHRIEGRLPGTHDLQREIRITTDEDVVHLRLNMVPLSRRDALAYNLILAGTGQRYVGRGKFGWVLSATEIGGVLVALTSELSMQNSRDDYLRAKADYAAAIAMADIVRLRGEIQDNYQEMTDAESRRDSAVTIAIAAVGLSVLDILLRFPSFEAGSGSMPTNAGIIPAGGRDPGDGIHVGLGFNF